MSRKRWSKQSIVDINRHYSVSTQIRTNDYSHEYVQLHFICLVSRLPHYEGAVIRVFECFKIDIESLFAHDNDAQILEIMLEYMHLLINAGILILTY